jgi:glycosyltransferase involved in cell wall biosynthesis
VTPRTLRAIHQLTGEFSSWDAIGNEILLMQRTISGLGLESRIYAESGLAPAESVDQLRPEELGDAALLYHFSVGLRLRAGLVPLSRHVLVRYHSVTPPGFFDDRTELNSRLACGLGRRQLPMVGAIAEAVAADSAYNADEIAPYTRTRPTVIPVLRDYDRLVSCRSPLDAALAKSSRPTLLFVGRITPNKCQQDLILLLHLSRLHLSKDLRLILVGGAVSENFANRLRSLSSNLGLSLGADLSDDRADIVIPESVSDNDMAAIYRHARVFVSMSEHEGYGVPLVEAMHFELPILAHAATAVPETVGDAGLLCDKNDWPGTLACLNSLLFDEGLRAHLLPAMRRRRQELSLVSAEACFKRWLHGAVGLA